MVRSAGNWLGEAETFMRQLCPPRDIDPHQCLEEPSLPHESYFPKQRRSASMRNVISPSKKEIENFTGIKWEIITQEQLLRKS